MGKLRIEYNAPNIPRIDDALEKVFTKLGMQFLSSGYNFKTNIRQLTYEWCFRTIKHSGINDELLQKAKDTAKVRNE